MTNLSPPSHQLRRSRRAAWTIHHARIESDDVEHQRAHALELLNGSKSQTEVAGFLAGIRIFGVDQATISRLASRMAA